MTQFVAFHVATSQATAELITQSCATFHGDNDYVSLLKILFRSARLSDANAECVVLSDHGTPLDSLANSAHVIRSDVDATCPMFSRLQAQIDFLERCADGDDVAFVDSDMIVNAPLAPIFAEDFDVAFTYRGDAQMPINGGVILVRGSRQANALRFLHQVRDCYAAKYAEQARWWGDQQALIDVVGRERFDRRTSDLLDVDGIRVRLLPCERYNFSPENEFRAIRRPLADKVILHFKGERKRLMPAYWNAYLAPRFERTWPAWWQAQRTRWELRFAA
jgi:hypothetical protein